jgi:phosphatidylglycerophosphate synthase
MTRRDSKPRTATDETADLTAWLDRHAAVMLAAVLAAATLRSGAWVTLAGALSFAALWYRGRRRLAELVPHGGYANGLTALRLALLLGAAAWMTEMSAAWLLLLFTANVAIDVLDGYVARHAAQVTQLGAVLDRETDAVFVMVAYLYFFLVLGFSAWLLLPALLPYVYRLLAGTRRDSPTPDHRERLAVALAGVNFVALLIAVAAPARAQPYVLALSASIVAASFLKSFWNLYRHEYSIP